MRFRFGDLSRAANLTNRYDRFLERAKEERLDAMQDLMRYLDALAQQLDAAGSLLEIVFVSQHMRHPRETYFSHVEAHRSELRWVWGLLEDLRSQLRRDIDIIENGPEEIPSYQWLKQLGNQLREVRAEAPFAERVIARSPLSTEMESLWEAALLYPKLVDWRTAPEIAKLIDRVETELAELDSRMRELYPTAEYRANLRKPRHVSLPILSQGLFNELLDDHFQQHRPESTPLGSRLMSLSGFIFSQEPQYIIREHPSFGGSIDDRLDDVRGIVVTVERRIGELRFDHDALEPWMKTALSFRDDNRRMLLKMQVAQDFVSGKPLPSTRALRERLAEGRTVDYSRLEEWHRLRGELENQFAEGRRRVREAIKALESRLPVPGQTKKDEKVVASDEPELLTEMPHGGDPQAVGWVEWDDRWVRNHYADGAVTVGDRKTGLMWLHDPISLGRSDWETARGECTSLRYAGYADWRLPEKEELHNLSKSPVPESPRGSWFWTNTPGPDSPDHAWVLGLMPTYPQQHFSYERPHFGFLRPHRLEYHMWPCRGGP